jgi:hypothetical protein
VDFPSLTEQTSKPLGKDMVVCILISTPTQVAIPLGYSQIAIDNSYLPSARPQKTGQQPGPMYCTTFCTHHIVQSENKNISRPVKPSIIGIIVVSHISHPNPLGFPINRIGSVHMHGNATCIPPIITKA